MNITIVKNSQSITTFNDETINLRRDGGFDTIEVHFNSKNPELLNRWDRITALSRTWRVAEQPTVKIDYDTDTNGDYTWLYTVVLIESMAVLQGWPMPNLAFTQNKAATKTIIDAIESILERQSLRSTTETQRYTLKSSLSLTTEDQNKIAPNDTFPDKSLYQILKYYGDLLDAKPVLDESDDTIDFVYLNDFDDTTILTPDFFNLEISKSVEDYATDLVENAENVYVEGITAKYPSRNKRIYFIPLNLDSNMDFDNASLELPFKVRRINEIRCLIDRDPVRYVNLYFDPDDNPINDDRSIFEEREWQVLQKNSFWSSSQWLDWGVVRESSVYFKYGDNKIYNLKALDYLMTQAGYSFSGIHQLLVYVEYEPLPDIEIKMESEETIDGGLKYIERVQQQSSSVDLSAEKLRLKNDLRNRQSTYFNVGFETDAIPSIDSLIKVTQISSQPECLITTMSAKRVGEKYEINARLATEYNRKNPLTRRINENRIYDIPTGQTITRKVIQEVKANFWCQVGSLIPTNIYETKWKKIQNFFFNFVNGEYNNTGNDLITKRGSNFVLAKFTSTEYGTIRVLLPYIKIVNKLDNGDLELIFVATMTSNTSADKQRYIDSTIPVNYTASSALVVDKLGEFDTVELSFMKVKQDTVSNDVLLEDDIIFTDSTPTDFPFKEAYPFVSSDYVLNDFTIRRINPFDELVVKKDAREQIQFETKIKISSDVNTTVNLDNIHTLIDWTSSSGFGNTPQIKAKINGNLADNNFVSVEYFDDYIKINYTYGATGTLTEVHLYVSGEEFLINNVNERVVSENQSDYLAIYIADII